MPTLQEQIGLARDREALPDDGGLRQKMAIAHATEKERKKVAEQAAKATQAAPQEAPAAAPELPGVAAQLGRVPGALAKRVAGGTLETGQMLEKGLARTAADIPAMLVESPTARAARAAAVGPNLLEQAGILSPESAAWIREKAIPVVADVVAGVVSTVSPKTPGFFLGEASKMLRAVGKTQEADAFDKVQAEATETVRAKAGALTEGYRKYLLGGGILDWSIEQTKPYLSETPAESVREVFTNPQLLAERLGGMVPYMAGTIALAIATKGMAAPFAMTYLVEGEGARQDAARRDASPAEQADIAQLVGFVVGAIEMWQVSKILEFVGGRAAQRAFAKKVSGAAVAKLAASEAAKLAWAKGASVGANVIRLSATEGGQEVLQQATQEIATSGITGEPLEPGFWGRLIQAGGVAAIASVLTGGLFSAGQKALGAKVAEAPSAAPAVTEGRGLPPTPDVLEPAPAEAAPVPPAEKVVPAVGAEPKVAPPTMPGALPEAVEAKPTPVREPLAPTEAERPPSTAQGLGFLPDERGEVPVPPEPKEPNLSRRVRAQLSPEAQKVQSVFDAQQEVASGHRKDWASSLLRKGRRNLLDVSGNTLAELIKTGNPDARRAARRHDLVLGAHGAATNRVEEASQKIFTDLAPAEESVLAFHLQAVRTIEASAVVAARGKELKHPGGMTPEQAQQWLDDARKTEGYEKIEKAAAAWDAMVLEELDRNHEAGLIGDEAYAFLRENHRHYYPRRFIQHMDPEVTQRFGTRRITVPDSGIKALDEGSEQLLVNDPRFFLAQILARGETRRKKNLANQSLAAFARAQPDNEIVREAKIVRTTQEGRPVFESVPKGMGTVRFLEGGQERVLFMPQELAEEWVTYSPEISSGAASVLRWVSLSPVLKAVATGYNPGFALTNVPRDVGLVWFASDWLSKEADTKLYSPHLPVYLMQMGADMAAVAGEVATNGPKVQQAAREGLFMEFLTHQGQVGRHPLTVKTGQFSAALAPVGKALGWIGEKSEILTRMALRERAMKNGADSETATYIARAYLDFAKGGGYTKFADSAIPYLNASVQGFRSGVKSAAANPAHFAYKVFQLGGAASGLALASLLLFPETWKRIPDEIKNRYFVFPLPSWLGGTYTDEKGQTRYRYLTVSKPEIIRPFASVFEATAEGLVTGDVPWQRMYGGLTDVADIVPLGKLPPSISAYFALVGNYDVWRKQEVWRGPSVDPEAEYTAYTHPLWRWFGETTGLSPERVASAVGDIIPPYNPYILAAMHATELAMKGAPEESKDSFYLKLATDVTGISRVLRSTPAYTRDEELEQIRVSENTRRHKQNIDLAERVAKGEPYRTIMRDFVTKQPRQDWKRLKSRATTSIKLRGIDSWWLNLREMPPLPRAQAFHVRFRSADEEERKALVAQARTVPGVGSETFWSAFRRFRAEVEKIQAPPKPPAKS